MNYYDNEKFDMSKFNRNLFYEEENVHNEIQQMFSDLQVGEKWGNQLLERDVNKKLTAYQLFYFEIADKKTNSKGFQKSQKSTYRIEGGEVKRTTVREKSFYGKEGNMKLAYELMLNGFSARKAADALGMSKNTTRKILRDMGDVKCKCGQSLLTHRGWCKYRYQQSEKRQEFMKQWGKRHKKNKN